MSRRAMLVAVAILVGVAGSAEADLFVLRPNDHAVGTNLSGLLPDASLATIFGDGSRSAVYASSTIYGESIGSLTLGGHNDIQDWPRCDTPSPDCLSAFGVLEILFDVPTDFVQIAAVWLSDAPQVVAFDAAGNTISRCYTGPCATIHNEQPALFTSTSTLTIARDGRDISRILFGGSSGRSEAYEVAYNVPEPTTLFSVVLGMVGAGVFGRRARARRRISNGHGAPRSGS